MEMDEEHNPNTNISSLKIEMPPPNASQKFPYSFQTVMNDHVEKEQEGINVPHNN